MFVIVEKKPFTTRVSLGKIGAAAGAGWGCWGAVGAAYKEGKNSQDVEFKSNNMRKSEERFFFFLHLSPVVMSELLIINNKFPLHFSFILSFIPPTNECTENFRSATYGYFPFSLCRSAPSLHPGDAPRISIIESLCAPTAASDLSRLFCFALLIRWMISVWLLLHDVGKALAW